MRHQITRLREKEMTASKEVIFAQISDFKAWDAWSPWKEKDPTIKNEFSGEPGTVGHTTSWVGDPDLSGTGSMKIIEIEENKMIKYELKFENPEMQSVGGIELVESENGVMVKWRDEGDIPFLFRPMMLFMNLEDMIGPDFERGLVKLDSIATIKQEELDQQVFEITEIDFPESYYYGVKAKVELEDIDSALIGGSYEALGIFTAENGAEMAGMPVNITLDWDMEAEKGEIMPAFPVVAHTSEGNEQVTKYTIPAGKALVIDYYGGYEGIGAAYEFLAKYVEENGIETTIGMEEYITDPATVESPDEILTKVYFFLK